MRNVGFMGTSTAVRLLSGLLTFAVMARALGANDFGLLMTAMAASVIVGLIASYGFANYALREIGATTRESGREVMAGVLTAKILLSAAMLGAAALMYPLIPTSWQGLFIVLLIARLFDTVTELLNVGFRATERFAAEARVATASAVVQFFLVATAMYVLPTPVAAAVAYAAARALVLVMTWMGQGNYFGGLRPAHWRQGVFRLRAAWTYALDYGLQSLFGQIDSLVLAFFFGPGVVGLYQAGMRFFLGGAQAASVLGNVAIPKLAGLWARGQPTNAFSARTQWAFIAVGMAGGLAFALVPGQLITSLLGTDYLGLQALLPWFGILFFVRLCAASSGVLLTAFGQQKTRATLTALHWIVVVALALWLLPGEGPQGWLMALIGGNAALALAYGVTLHLKTRTGVAGWAMAASVAGGAVLFALATVRA